MIFTDIEHFKNEVKLTIENTEELYKLALDVVDFNYENNQISNLLSATIRQINQNSHHMTMMSREDKHEIYPLVVRTVHQLQEESK